MGATCKHNLKSSKTLLEKSPLDSKYNKMHSVAFIILLYFNKKNVSLGTTNDFILPLYFVYVPFVDSNSNFFPL